MNSLGSRWQGQDSPFGSLARSTAEFAEMIEADRAKWKKFVAEAKISVE